jgi:hypothetical protein
VLLDDLETALLSKKRSKLNELSEKILKLNDDETGLAKYFRTKLDSDGKGGLIAKVQPIIATYGSSQLKTFQSGASIKRK